MSHLKIYFDREYVDKTIDKTKDRHQLNKMLRNLKNGDIIYCESISRLRRSLKDLIEIIAKEGIDTNSSTYKLLLAVFGELAEMVRETIQEIVIHCNSKVQPEHYPIVGKHLLGAIKEVLGDDATEDIINAWAKTYGVIAEVFINNEKEMYASR